MGREEIERIVEVITKECEMNFESHKITKYTLAELSVIPFVTKEIKTRKVSDWGTDEDTDEYIWYSEWGWQYSRMVVRTGAGDNRVIENDTVVISKEQVVKYILECNLLEQIQFIHKAYSVLATSQYKYDLR